MSAALREFQARMSELEEDLAFVTFAASLRPRLSNALHWEPSEETDLARHFIATKGARLEGVLGSLLVRVLAALERYLRRLVEELIKIHQDNAANFDDLSEHVRVRNMVLSGRLLASLDSPRSHFVYEYQRLITNLASCGPGRSNFRLNGAAFGAVVSGTGPTTIETALANVGIKNWWDRIGDDLRLSGSLGTNGARATGKRARQRLEEIWRWRNHLAHGGDDEITLSEAQFRDCLDFVKTLAEALDGVATADVIAGAT